MTDIKMSEVFDLPMTSGKIAMGFYLNKDHCDEFCREAEFYKEAELAAIAINAYDGNQERIDSLTHESALLENQLKNAQAEIAELKKKAQGY